MCNLFRNKKFIYLAKVLVLALMGYFIYAQIKQVYNNPVFSSKEFLIILSKLKWSLVFVVLLMPLNWFVEAIKWKYICSVHKSHITIKQSIIVVLKAANAGFISPGRWGEPAMKAYHVQKVQMQKGMLYSLSGIVAQWIITICVAVLFTYKQSRDVFSIPLALCLLILFLLLYIFYEKCYEWIRHLFSLQEKWQTVEPISLLNKGTIFLLSALRYSIYSIQYIILFSCFMPYPSLFNASAKLSQLFFIQSFSPFPGIIDYAFKNNIALALYQNTELQGLPILLCVFYIWLINLVIPALIGYGLYYTKNK